MSGSARLEHTVLLLGRLNIFPRWKPLAHTILKEATADDGVSGGEESISRPHAVCIHVWTVIRILREAC